MSSNTKKDTYIVVCLYNKREQIAAMCKNVDHSHTHNAEQMKERNYVWVLWEAGAKMEVDVQKT